MSALHILGLGLHQLLTRLLNRLLARSLDRSIDHFLEPLLNQLNRMTPLRSLWLGLLCLFTTVSLGLLPAQPSVAATPRHYTDLDLPPLPELQLPDYTRFELDNGMVVFLVEDHELPLVNGVATIRTGSRFEPADRVGLADVTGSLMRSGGTQSHPADELDLMLEQIAASVETGISTTEGSASFNSLTEDLDTVFGLFAEVLTQPAFAEDKFQIIKTQARGSIARRNDDPDGIAAREFEKLIYGADSPYARTVEYATLDRVTRADVAQFYAENVTPDRIILGIVGDFDTGEMKQRVIERFGAWSVRAHPLALPAVDVTPAAGVYFVDRPDLTQSYIQMGHLGGLRSSPDYPTLGVMNEVLNGFGGRLFNEVRSRQGLAYTVYAAWSANYDYPGVFIAGGQTRSESTVNFIRSVRDEIQKIRREPISPEELQAAKDKTLNSFIFNFADPAQTLSRLLRYEYYGYPQDFIFQYQRGVEAATIADVQRVAQAYLKPEALTIMVVGNTAEVQATLGELTPGKPPIAIDVSIPEA